MRTVVKYTSRFRRDYKREKAGRHNRYLDAELLKAVNILSKDERLPRRYFDLPLSGEWSDHRACHIRPDLILIYRKPDETGLELVRLGSHTELACEVASVAVMLGFEGAGARQAEVVGLRGAE